MLDDALEVGFPSSPGSPHMKYSFTREKPFSIARRQPANRSSLLIGLPIRRRISSRAASGAKVRPRVPVGAQQTRPPPATAG